MVWFGERNSELVRENGLRGVEFGEREVEFEKISAGMTAEFEEDLDEKELKVTEMKSKQK